MTEIEKTRIMIVDDHPVFRRGMVTIIEEDARLQVVAQAGSSEDALVRLETCRPDVLVLDVDLPGRDGLSLARELMDRPDPIPIVLLTMHKSERILNAAMDLGVSGYILKDEAEAGIVAGIKHAARGEHYVSPSLSMFLMRRGKKRAELAQAHPGLHALTPMERAVLKRVAQNQTSRQIGQALFISYRTVETHRANICAKLCLTGSHPLLQFALENKSSILSLPED